MIFADFRKALPPLEIRTDVPNDIFEEYKERLPRSLRAEWQELGWGGYGDGLIWIVNPATYHDLLNDTFSKHLIFARTAWGDLFSVCNNDVYCIMTQHGECRKASHDFDLFGAMGLTSESFLKDFLRISLFKKAFKKLGPLNSDECYALTPPLAFGGDLKMKNIKKAKLDIYLDICIG